MRAEIRTPYSRSPARERQPDVWRKKLLPVGSVEYKGRMLEFSPEYLQALADAYAEGAYDQVPFQLADAHNTHTNDPERYRGEIIGMDVREDGLYITARTTPDGSKLLMTNPRLGVSARIVEGYDRSDGRHYEAAVQHVLGTLDPRIPNLGAWEAVEMSNVSAPDYVIDLTAASFAGEEGGGITMPELDANQQDRLARLLELDPEKLDALISGIEDGEDDSADFETDDMSDDELVAAIDEMDDDEFRELMAEFGEEAGEPALAGASLSNSYGHDEVELTNYRVAEVERQNALIQRELDAQRFANEKRQLMNLGVPAYIVDMAQPLLQGAGHVVELSNGQGLDAGRLMRDVLKEFGKASGMLDLGSEMGSAIDEPDTSEAAATGRRDFVQAYRQITGI